VGGTFEDVYASSFRRIASAVRPLAGADAEDVANEAFVVAWTRWDEVGRFDLPDAWVRTVARRIALARARREAMRASREASSGETRLDNEGPRDIDISAAIRRLPEPARAAVALHYTEDRALAEVAEALETIEPTVKTWLHRARPLLAEDVSGLRGRWVLDTPIHRDELRRRAVEAGAGRGLDAVMARMPRRRARWILTVDGARYLMINEDGEYFDDGRIRWQDAMIHLRSTTAPDGDATYVIQVDGSSLSIRVRGSTMHLVDGVADRVYHTTMFDAVTLSWQGYERIPARVHRG
jgi:RNA polymerase sigma-70 factor (ECF subfamily)